MTAPRIGYLVPVFPSQTHVFFWREIQALRGLGAALTLLSTQRPGPDACRHDFAAEASAQTHYVFPPRWLASIWQLIARPDRTARAIAYVLGLGETPWPRRLKLLGLLLPAADLRLETQRAELAHLHVHSCADAAHLAVLCHRLGGPPFSLTLHGDLPVYGTDHRRKAADARFVSCVTRALQGQLERDAGVAPERAPVIWMGVETERFRDVGARVFETGHLHLLTVARLNFVKGHKHALAAMRRLLDRGGVALHYTIAGDGPLRDGVVAEIARLGLQDHVTLTGTLSEGEVLSLLQRADVLLLPSIGLGEAAPVAVMEAMACALPVVCSVIGGTPDMIEDEVDGFLVAQQDEAAIAERLARLGADVALRRRIGAAARERAVRDFDARRSAAKLLAHITGEATVQGARP